MAIALAFSKPQQRKTIMKNVSKKKPNLTTIIPKNNQNEIHVSPKAYRGRLYIDIRNYYYDGTKWLPTRRGIRFNASAAKKLRVAVKRAARAKASEI